MSFLTRTLFRKNPREPIDLGTYQFGLYSYYAEDSSAQLDQAHLDPYYTQQDLKDPELLARAKRYFESLRNEVLNLAPILFWVFLNILCLILKM